MPGFDARTGYAAQGATFEFVLADGDQTFVWRIDDYPWERNRWNFHPEIEIHLIRSGSGIAFVGDSIADFEPGYLAIVGPNLPHDWVTPLAPGQRLEGRDLVIQFHPDKLRAGAAVFPELGQLEGFLARTARGLRFHGETRRRAAEMIEAMGATTGPRRLAALLELLDLLARSREYEVLSSTVVSPAAGGGSVNVLQAAMDYIFANFNTDISLSDVAARIGMSDSTFSRFFQKYSGTSFTNHLNALRIWQACRLLAETSRPVTDICFEVGYHNISNFNRVFRRHHNMTPSSYRQLTRHRHGSAEASLRSGAP